MPKPNRINVLIVDDIADTRDNLKKLLLFEKDMEVVGAAADGRQAIEAARKLSPDIVLMDINMPGLDGISATEAIRTQGLPSQVIMMSVQDESDFLRRSMLAGAREFLVKPFSGEELVLAIRRVYERADRPATQAIAGAVESESHAGRIVAVFSPKGGVGRTTIASNLAIALKLEHEKSVALVDCSLPFGDVGVILNLQPTKTIVDLLPHVASLDGDLLHDLLLRHSSGVDVLLAPTRPEMAELVTADSLKAILSKLRESYDYVVADTAPSFHETNLAVLDLSDRIVVPLTLEVPAIKNVRLFLEVAHALGYPRDKLQLVLNRAGNGAGISSGDVEARLGRPIAVRIASDGLLATFAMNQGMPFVMLNRASPLSQSVFDLARLLDKGSPQSGLQASASARDEPPEAGGGIGRLIRLPWRGKASVQISHATQ